MVFIQRIFVSPAFSASTTGEREAERVGRFQWEEQGTVWVADADGEQSLSEWGRQYWWDDREATEGNFSAKMGQKGNSRKCQKKKIAALGFFH